MAVGAKLALWLACHTLLQSVTLYAAARTSVQARCGMGTRIGQVSAAGLTTQLESSLQRELLSRCERERPCLCA